MARPRSFPLYRWVNRLNHGLRQRLSPLGGWLFGAWIAAGAFGVNTRIGMTYQLFVLLTLLFATAWLVSRFGQLAITAHRLLPRFATVGESVRYRLQCHNRSSQVQQDLVAVDELRESSAALKPLGRFTTYYQWHQRAARARGARTEMQALPPLPPGAMTEAELTLLPTRRGWLELAAIRIGRPEPLGLMRRLFRRPLEDRLLVLPRRYPVPGLHFHGGRRYQRGGVSLAQSVGEADEFIGLREYRPGDPPRRIHWRSFAKRGQLIVKEFQDEFFVRYGLLLDSFATGIVDDTRFEAAVSAAASIAAVERSPEALLDLLFVGDRAYCFTAGRGLGQTEQLLEILACVAPNREQSFSHLLALVAGHAADMSACVCILLDWDEERRQLIHLLRGQGVEIVALVIGPPSAPPDADVVVATVDTLAEALACLTSPA